MFATEEYQAPIKSIVAGMHAAGASQGVVNAMLARYFEMEAVGKAGQLRLDPEYIQSAEADLRKEWGSSYDENVAFADDYLSQSPVFVELELHDGPLFGSHPAFVRQVVEVGRMSNEGQLKCGISGNEMAGDMMVYSNWLPRGIFTVNQSIDRSRIAILSAQRSFIAERLRMA